MIMIIEIKKNDELLKLLDLLSSKTIKPEKFRQIVDAYELNDYQHVDLPSLLDMPFKFFVEIEKAENQIDKYAEFAKLQTPKTCGEYLDMYVFLRKEMRKIRAAFRSAQMPQMSEYEQLAGFGNVNFGYYGVIDMLACRQGVADEVIENTKLRNIIGKLTIISHKAKCEKRLTELIRQRKK